jgi:hypothetical protein
MGKAGTTIYIEGEVVNKKANDRAFSTKQTIFSQQE